MTAASKAIARGTLCLIGLLSFFAASCGPSIPPLKTVQLSREALARAVLDSLERRDGAALRELALDESEFRDHIWPELPAARPARNLPFSYVWGDLHQKSEAALGGTLAKYGGEHFDFVATQSTGESTQYQTYLVHRKTEVTVRDASGAERRLRLFGSTLEKDGGYKVFSFVVDE